MNSYLYRSSFFDSDASYMPATGPWHNTLFWPSLGICSFDLWIDNLLEIITSIVCILSYIVPILNFPHLLSHSINNIQLIPLELIKSNRDGIRKAKEALLIYKDKAWTRPLNLMESVTDAMKLNLCKFLFISGFCTPLCSLLLSS